MAHGAPNPLVTIITPSFNHAAYLRTTIESVLAQDYPHVEHIVVDGASTDGTVGILRTYGERYPDRFRWISEHDQGQSDAFNKGLALARGAIVGWQNSDDYYLPRVFSEPVHYLMEHPAVGAIFSDYAYVDEAGHVIGSPTVEPFDPGRLLVRNYVANQAAFARTAILRELGGLRRDLHYVMDLDLWLRLGLRHQIEYLPGIRGAWRILPGAKSWANRQHVFRELIALQEETLSSNRLTAQQVAVGTLGLCNTIGEALLQALSAGENRSAREYLRRAQSHDLNPLPHMREFTLDHAVARLDPAEREDSARLCAALVHFLTRGGAAATTEIRASIALMHLSRAIQAAPYGARNAALSNLLRAWQVDAWWLRRRSGRRALAEVLFGAHSTAVAREMLATLRAHRAVT